MKVRYCCAKTMRAEWGAWGEWYAYPLVFNFNWVILKGINKIVFNFNWVILKGITKIVFNFNWVILKGLNKIAADKPH